MKSHLVNLDRRGLRAGAGHPRSGGAVIIIVLTLLATMVFLGFFFFGFTDQAQLAARSYATADDAAGVLNPEGPFDQALEQLIVGTRLQYEESALWGGRHSILSHIVGPIDGNLRPLMDSMYAGGGMQLVETDSDGNGKVDCYAMDYTGDGVADDLNSDNFPDHIAYTFNETGVRTYTPYGQFTLNFSRVAQPQFRQDAFNSLTYGYAQATQNQVSTALNPAVGYTYPDLSNLFLSSETTVSLPDAGTSQLRPVKVIIPSFFRPQLLLAERQAGSGGTSALFTDPNYASLSLRPHASHKNLSGFIRFLSTSTVAQSGDTSRLIRPFPFNYDRDFNSIANEFGMLSNPVDSDPDTASSPAPRSNYYEYDVDNDGDGKTDSIWMDLGLPMIDLSDGRQVVPLVAFKVVDADGLFNVNVHGNLAGLYFPNDLTLQTGYFDANMNGSKDANELSVPFHRSNMGLGPNEINLSYGMFDDVMSTLSPADQNKLFREYLNFNLNLNQFVSSSGSTRHATAAAEAMFLLTGRLPYGDDSALAGRHGETNVLLSYLNGGASASLTPPRAGRTDSSNAPTAATQAAADDDLDYQTSGGQGYITTNGVFPNGKVLVDYSNGIQTATNITMPPAVHPLPLNGAGISYLASNTNGAQRLLKNAVPNNTIVQNNPATWPDYTSGHWHDQNYPNAAPLTGPRPYSQAGVTPGSLQAMNATVTGDTVDEEKEIVALSSFPNPDDSPFAPSENALLQLSKNDFALSGESTRLRELAPFSFRDSPTPNPNVQPPVPGYNGAEANRKMYTTDSWDRNEMAFFPKRRAWEFNTWVSGDTLLHFPPKFGTIGNNFLLSAPYASQNTLDPFRYQLRRLLATSLGGYDVNGPNYEEARVRPQMPLNLNRLLTGFDNKGNPQFRELVPHPTFTIADGAISLPSSASPPAFNSIGYDNTAAGLPGRINAEWWARQDRQNMARDIFTLLWVLSGGKDGSDYTTPGGLTADVPPSMPPVEDTTTPGREDDHYDVANGNAQTQIEARDRIREMAQFAVNVVDALDRDSVITEFRYDENLTDGWDVSSTYQVVYGVEAAQLTLSEVLAIRTPPIASSSAIEYADPTHNRYHLFVELRNASPFPVSIQSEEWRIRRIPNTAINPGDRYAVLRDSVFTSVGGNPGFVGPGDQYLISSQDGGNKFGAGQYRTSDFRVDYDSSGTFDCIAPNSYDATPPTSANTFANYPLPLCDLDLFANGTLPNASHVGRYWANSYTGNSPQAQFTDPTAAPAVPSLLNWSDINTENGGASDVTNNVTIVLERRRLPGAGDITDPSDTLGVGGNPWIEVDRMPNVTVQLFNVASTPLDTQLKKLKSTERREPFYPRTNQYNDATNTSVRQHTLPQLTYSATATPPGPLVEERNSSLPAGTNFTYWQPHFDRDFTSVMDLLSIPLYGYSPATTQPLGVYDQRLDRKSDGTDDMTSEARMFRAGGPTKNLVDINGKMSGHRTAAMRILHPESSPASSVLTPATESTGYDGDATPSAPVEIQKHFRNRWYRLLEFVRVPDRVDELARQKVAFDGRTPGKLNLNMIRNEQVMAGLIDDPVHLNPLLTGYPGTAASPIGLTKDALEPALTPRNWFLETQALRDQPDPILGLTLAQMATSGISIPGNVKSVPFRPLGYIDSSGDLSITQTILRDRVPAADTDMPPDNILDTPGHGLFEARTQADAVSATDSVDFHTRNRLLAKIHNRTTTRSHVFFVWTTIGFFEAHQPPVSGATGYVTIGAQAEDLPNRRMFAVVDMSRLEEAYDDADPTDATPGTFDFRKFVIYRKTIK